MLCCFVKGYDSAWDVHVPEFIFALNSFVHDATGFSPAELFLHRKIVGPGEWVDDTLAKPLWSSSVESMFTSARNNMQQQANRNKREYDRKRQDVKLHVGCKVLLKLHALSNLKKHFSAKLAPRWRSPYLILQQSSPVAFVLQDVETKEKRIAHVDQLKLVS
ncbi:hypothetical protein HOLleu_21107 [Holothuria leucospilota]|uniref:Uncharacterized protein n=1 Tax=Holothuria leucospilota TaxID=206669 RepID=A0A9Q1BVZ1_HOLLE|nr:hypothetical protein HOLleu_21107 [Holothuria leucospilota]